LRVTKRGLPFQRLAAAAFDAYLSGSPAHDSLAV
jgi:hypothetical protein